jgi:hypothetical protein
MINGVIEKGSLNANAYQIISLATADPGYPIAVTIKLINTNGDACLASIYTVGQNDTTLSNGDSIYNQYQLEPYASLLIDVLIMSFDESIILLSSASNVNYYVTGVQSPA